MGEEELTIHGHIVNFLSWFWIPGAIHATYVAIKLCVEWGRCLCPVFYNSRSYLEEIANGFVSRKWFSNEWESKDARITALMTQVNDFPNQLAR
jgi:hypothetical protein